MMESLSFLNELRALPETDARWTEKFAYGQLEQFEEQLAAQDRDLFATRVCLSVQSATIGLLAGHVAVELADAHTELFGADLDLETHFGLVKDRGEDALHEFIGQIEQKLAEVHSSSTIADHLTILGVGSNDAVAAEWKDRLKEKVGEVWSGVLPKAVNWEAKRLDHQVAAGHELAAHAHNAARTSAHVAGSLDAQTHNELFDLSSQFFHSFGQHHPELVKEVLIAHAEWLDLEHHMADALDAVTDYIGLEDVPVLGLGVGLYKVGKAMLRDPKGFEHVQGADKFKLRLANTMSTFTNFLTRSAASHVVPVVGGMAASKLAGGQIEKASQRVTGLSSDQVYYLKEKPKIDKLGIAFHKVAYDLRQRCDTRPMEGGAVADLASTRPASQAMAAWAGSSRTKIRPCEPDAYTACP